MKQYHFYKYFNKIINWYSYFLEISNNFFCKKLQRLVKNDGNMFFAVLSVSLIDQDIKQEKFD